MLKQIHSNRAYSKIQLVVRIEGPAGHGVIIFVRITFSL